MTKYVYLLLAIAFISCSSEKKSEAENNDDFKFSYAVDTVMVDAGEHFFFLNEDLELADVSPDRKLLYNLNPKTFLLEIVDLDNLKLEKTVQLEKEGPDGIGLPYYGKIQVLENGNICLFGQFKIHIVTEQGKLVKTIELDQIKIKNNDQKEEEKIGWNSVLSDDGKLLASTLVNFDYKTPAKGIVVIELETDSIKYIPMNLFQELKQFEIIHQEGNAPGIISGESTYLSFIGDKLIVSSSAYNDVYRYNTSSDSLSHYSFKASLTDNEKIRNFPNEVHSSKEWTDAEKAKNEQVSFQEFLKLPEQNIFWRVSTDKDRMIADSVVFKQVATFFDADFKMLNEQELENFHSSRKPFFKDGMLYSFINIEDEMAFIRLKPILEE
ncbi:DUF4221 family protein [Algoriphagus aquimarinus]|uniref:DUF4221 domain-containing protein n=1 Tax=Algoriphagus aquimarinus TaxID=237018 RepID=A0A5C7B8G2_9BACT|nr:DUF4221 family protein [Algoriphagus aquimarinus]TXE14795.1 DUF4221 domain-containing protein [Algoriphagus aquimarinus]